MKSIFTGMTLALLATGCASTPKTDLEKGARLSGVAKPTAEAEAPLLVIDAHTHTEFTGKNEPISGIPMTRDEYLRQLRDAGVVGAIAHTHQGKPDYFDMKKDGVMHCAGVTKDPDYAEVERGLKSGKYGCIKVYLGYQYRWAYEEAYRKLYRLAERYDIPVVFHTGDTYSTKGKLKYADPLTIDEVAVDFPKVRFVIAHCGNPWIQSAAEVAYKNPNVYLEGSALLIGNMDEQPREKVDEYVVKPLAWIFGYLEDPKKLMFGTDWPLSDIGAYLRAFQRAIPREHWQAVFHDNAARVFRLQTAKRQPPVAAN